MIHSCVHVLFFLFAAEIMWRKEMSGMLLYLFFLSFCCKKKCTQTSNSVDALPNKMLFNCDGVLL